MNQNTKNYFKSGKFFKEFLIMTFGMMVAAIAVHYFLQPSKMIVGSISGLSIVIYRITGIPVSALTFVINIILLVLAFILIGKEFGAKTVYTALVLSPWLWLFEAIDKKFNIDPSKMFDWAGGDVDYWFYLFCFVIILSLSQAILFRINASTGGLDIIAKIVNKYAHIDIGTSVTVAGAIICCSAFAVPGNSLYLVFMGFIGTWINGLMVDHFTAGLNARKRVCIISPKYQELQEFIVHDLVRGVTLYEVTGGYSNEKKVELEAILTNDEFAKLMEKIRVEDIPVFMTSGRVSEIYGTWNQHKRKAYKHDRPRQEQLEKL
ncbi:MAG: YitT family protein [Bacteroidales bacterium]|nr:YitT family protein [Bacteroidales bacterium]